MTRTERRRRRVVLVAAVVLFVAGAIVHIGPLDHPVGMVTACAGAALVGQELRRSHDRHQRAGGS